MQHLFQEQPYFTEYHKMTKPQVKIVNCTTGEEIVRDANEQELAQMELDAANAVARKAEAEAKATAKAALLERLGITQDEANLLLS
jgi:hypothetical protein